MERVSQVRSWGFAGGLSVLFVFDAQWAQQWVLKQQQSSLGILAPPRSKSSSDGDRYVTSIKVEKKREGEGKGKGEGCGEGEGEAEGEGEGTV